MNVHCVYMGYEILKTGRSFQDYYVNLDGRSRWGAFDEIIADIDNYIMGVLIPFEPNK